MVMAARTAPISHLLVKYRRCPAQPLDALNRPDLLGLARREGVVRDVEGRRT